MKKLLVIGSLFALGSICLQDISSGHGGTYRGPGDTVPPGGGGGGGGGTGPSNPGPGAPTGGSSPGPNQPGPTGGGPPTGGANGGKSGVPTGGPSTAPDLTMWEFWWGFNKDQYLQLKAAIYDPGQESDNDIFFQDGRTAAKKSLKPSEESIRNKIVPALKEVLAKERSNDIVTGALIALGKIGDVKNGDDGTSEFEPIISKFLADPSQEIAETAAVALGILANDHSVEALKNLALDNVAGRASVGTTEVTYRTRAFATYGLGLIGNRTIRNEVRQSIARTLIEILNKRDNSTRDVKVAALIALGLVPIDVEQDGNLDAKSDFTTSRQTQIKFIQNFFADQNQHYLVRAHAPTAMARLLNGAPAGLREDIGALLSQQIGQFSAEKKEEVQQSCVLALGQIGTCGDGKVDKDIRKALVLFADQFGDQQSKNFALVALAQIGGRGQGEAVADVRQELRTFILENLTNGKSHARPWAGIAAGILERGVLDGGGTQSRATLETLVATLKDEKQPDRLGACAIGLGIARHTDGAMNKLVLEKMRKTSEWQPKGYLCVALGLMGYREATKDIEELVRDSKYKPELLRQASIGLGLLGDKDVVPDLMKMLAEAKGLASQAAIASALGFIGDARSIDPLVAMLQRKEGITDTARGFAAVALGIVADKEMLPWNSKISTNINYRANMPTLTGEGGTGILDIL